MALRIIVWPPFTMKMLVNTVPPRMMVIAMALISTVRRNASITTGHLKSP